MRIKYFNINIFYSKQFKPCIVILENNRDDIYEIELQITKK